MSTEEPDDEKPALAPEGETPDDAKPEAPVRERKRDAGSRIRLIEKLPKLGFASWSAKEDFKADEEWAGIVSLRSDAVLSPLESLAPSRRGESR
jgi:hypothetical protein